MPQTTIGINTTFQGTGSGAAQVALGRVGATASKAERDILSYAAAVARSQRQAGDAAGAVKTYEAALSQVDRTSKQAIASEKQLASAINAVERAAGGLGPALPRTIAGLTGSALSAAKSFVLMKVANEGLDFIKTGAEVSDVTKSFNSLAVAAGTTGDALLTSLRAASNNTITDASLIKNANLGLLLTQGQIAKSLPQLTQIAQASAKATGQSVDFIFESLVRGISRGSAKIIDNAGITLDGEKAYSDYAASIGKTADQLTKAEQQQAVTNAVLKTGAQIVKDVGINAEDASVKIAQAITAVENLKTSISARIAPTAGSIAGGIAGILDTGNVVPGATAGRDQAQAGILQKASSFEDYAARVQAANAQVEEVLSHDPIGALFIRQQVTLEQLNPVQFAYAQSLVATGVASADAVTKARALADVSDLLVRQTQGQDAAFQALIPKMAQVSSYSAENASQVLALNSAFLQGQVSADQVRVVLDALAHSHQLAAQAAGFQDIETRRLTGGLIGIVPAAHDAAGALADLAAAGAKPINNHINEAVVGALDPATVGKNIAAGSDAAKRAIDKSDKEAKDAADKAARLSDVLFDNKLKKTKDNAAKIALLRQREANTSDPIERAQIEGQIIDLQNQKNTGLSKQLDLNERNYDSIAKQRDALLDIEELTIRDRQQDREDAKNKRIAERILASPNASADLKARAQDALALIDVKDRQRANEIAEKQTTADASIVDGKLIQSKPNAGGAVAPNAAPVAPIAPPVAGSAPVSSPVPAADSSAAGAQTIVLQLVDGGQVLAKTIEPFTMDALMGAIRNVSVGT